MTILSVPNFPLNSNMYIIRVKGKIKNLTSAYWWSWLREEWRSPDRVSRLCVPAPGSLLSSHSAPGAAQAWCRGQWAAWGGRRGGPGAVDTPCHSDEAGQAEEIILKSKESNIRSLTFSGDLILSLLTFFLLSLLFTPSPMIHEQAKIF